MDINPEDYLQRFRGKRLPPHKRAWWQQQIADLTGRTFQSILGQTKEMTLPEIEDIYTTAKNWNQTPDAKARFCNKLLKQKVEEIKNQKLSTGE